MRGELCAIPVVLTAWCFGFEAPAAQAPSTSRPAGAESLIRRLAGSWKEDVGQRKIRTGPALRFRHTASGGLEEFRGPQGRPEIQPVVFDGKTHAIPGSKNSIAWKQFDPNRFERQLFGEGGKLVSTRRIRISADGKTLTEEVEWPARGTTTTSVYRRDAGEARGLAGTWLRESVQGGVQGQVTIEPEGEKAIKESQAFGNYTVMLDGAPAPVTGDGMVSRMMVRARPLDESAIEMTFSRDGVVTSEFTRRLSPDGKTMTVSSTVFGPDGSRREPNTYVYKRQ